MYEDARRRDRLLTDVGALFESFSYDRAETIERFLRIAGGIAPFDHFCLVLRNDQGVEIIASAGLKLPAPDDPEAHRIEDFQPKVGEGALRFVIDEVDEETENPVFPADGPVRSYVVVPLAAPSKAVGLLLLGSSRPRAFDEKDMDLYFTIGSQLAVALENIRFHRDALEQVEALTALHASELSLSRITDVRRIEERIVRTACDVLGARVAVLYAVSADDGATLLPRAVHPVAASADTAEPAGAEAVSLAEAEARTLVAERTVHAWAEGSGAPPSYRPPGARAVLAVPILEEGRVAGVLVVGGRTPWAFPPKKRSILELFAAHAASVLANAHLYARLGAKAEELERSNLLVQQYAETLRETNVALEKRLYELSTLYEVVSQAATGRDLDHVLRFILEKACVVMSSEKGSLLMVENDRLRTKVSRGVEGAEGLEFAKGEGVAGWVAATGHPKIVEDTTREPRFLRRSETPARPETMLCVPLKKGDEVIGVLNVDRDLRYGAFTPEEARLLTTLASAAEGTIQRILLLEDLSAIVDEVLEAFAVAVEARDKYTYGHSKRVRAISLAIARRLRLADEEVETIGRAALLHDVGKIGIPNEILLKPGRLTPEEFEAMKEHVVFGERILKRIRRMAEVAKIVRHHHERWDGAGYPDGLAGDRIPIGSAIIAVADAYDTIVTERPYRPASTREEAIEELRRCGGRQFHPLVVGAFLSLAEKAPAVEAVRERAASAGEEGSGGRAAAG